MSKKRQAPSVREIFELYLQHRSLLSVVQELKRRGLHAKSWQIRNGHQRGGKPFGKIRLLGLLTNVTYTEKLTYKDNVHEGQYKAIVTTEVLKQVQVILRNNGSKGGSDIRGG